ncbi:hypothetical protein [Burkholderia ambifaria]|uniref:hypothetical protein n=1 Tax=Burkholderia ambifaria TaxID=152480 RepID=UPI001B90B256|nr:hypothetical protein [Burkholderia ambifaria]MBR8176601.1 hypothetical protein [Burkholderia ambifaria]
MSMVPETKVMVSSSECNGGKWFQCRLPRVMALVVEILLFGMCITAADESFAGSNNDMAYNDCSAFVFDNEDDDVLSSYNNSFSRSSETRWSKGNCVALLSAGNRTPFLGATDSWGNWLNSRIAITIRRNDDFTLPSVHFCGGNADYNACMEKALLTYYGFRLDDRKRWRLRPYQSKDSFGFSLEQSISNTLDGTIERSDGIAVFAVRRSLDTFSDESKKWWVELYVIRHTSFGYVILSSNPNGDPPLLIPQDSTPESYAQAIPLINRLVQIVQSVRIK